MEGIFPGKLSVAIIICLHKKGRMCLLENYHAISLLVAFSKIFEKLVSVRLLNYFMNNGLFAAAQFGFIPGSSAEDAVQGIVKSLYNAFDAGESALAVFLDQSNAFDSIDRQILCQKFNSCDIQGSCLKWFESYLGRRRQVVRFGDVLSDELSSGYGVPQGGVISAVLFIIYINDLVKCTNEVEIAIYADDTNLFTTGNCMKQNIEKINRGLASIHSGCLQIS